MTNTQIKIYHNPRCSKSREALNLIEAKGFKAFVVEYIKNPPTYAEIKDLLMKLNLKPQQIIRTNEALYKEKFKNKNFSNEEWIKILSENPILIERPIIVKNNKAIIGRPPQLLEDLF